MKPWRDELRTIRGQFILFGATFLGAIVLALLALQVRNRFFEYYVKENYPVLEETNRKRIQELAEAAIEPNRLREILKGVRESANWQQVYGAWINDPDLDPENRLAKRLAGECPDQLLDALRRTLVVGNPSQRGRAVAWLALFPDRSDRVLELVRFARTRAQRRHEEGLLEKADAVLD
jgi:hypothetical protein